MVATLTAEKKIADLSVEKSDKGTFLDTSHLSSDLKKRAVRGGAATFAGQIVVKGIQFGSLMVLCRILTPRDFGLIAMIRCVTSFAEMFKDPGLSMATVQKEKVTHDQVSMLFWINLVLSISTMIVVIALAPVMVLFYGEPRLLWLTIILSVGFVFGGFAVQHSSLLRRQMRFTTLAAVNIAAVGIGATVGITTAFAGAGVWSLVYMSLTGILVGTFAIWFVCDWRPGRPKRNAGVRGMLFFGGNLTCSNFLNYLARNMDNILIGRFWGAGQLGLYNRAYQLLMLPLRQVAFPIASVAIPTLSRLQNIPAQYRHYYYRAVNLIAFITIPLVLMMAALSDEIIMIVLGKRWIDAAVIFKVLAFAAVFEPLSNTASWVYVSLGQTKRMVRWELVSVPVIVMSFVIGLPWGVLGVATSYSICFVLFIAVPRLHFAFRYSPLNVAGFFGAVWRPLVMGIIMYVVIELTSLYLSPYGSVLAISGCFIFVSFTFLLLLFFWRGLRAEFSNLIDVIKILRK